MNRHSPSISLNVDVKNPGQFFACCGLLELADRLWPTPGVAGWFHNNQFQIATFNDDAALEYIVKKLRETKIIQDDKRGEKATRPIHIETFSITLDWWINESGEKTRLKPWAGNQTSRKIIEDLQANLPETANCDLFDYSNPSTGRLGVDPRSAWNALDVGFSPNEQGMVVTTFAAVELLAAIGLQGFRPCEDKETSGFYYATWEIPLPVCIGRAASASLVPVEGMRYLFHITNRGQYKGFEYATPVRGEI